MEKGQSTAHEAPDCPNAGGPVRNNVLIFAQNSLHAAIPKLCTSTTSPEFERVYNCHGRVVYEATYDRQLENRIWTISQETETELGHFRFGFHSFSRDSSKVIYRGTSTIPAPRRTPVSPCKNTASLRRIKIAHRIILKLYLCQTTISRYNLHIRGGIHQISTQQQMRTTDANEIKKAHALAQPAPQNIQPSPRSSYLAQKKNTIDTLGCPKVLAGNQAAGNRVL